MPFGSERKSVELPFSADCTPIDDELDAEADADADESAVLEYFPSTDVLDLSAGVPSFSLSFDFDLSPNLDDKRSRSACITGSICNGRKRRRGVSNDR